MQASSDLTRCQVEISSKLWSKALVTHNYFHKHPKQISILKYATDDYLSFHNSTDDMNAIILGHERNYAGKASWSFNLVLELELCEFGSHKNELKFN